MKMQRTVNGVVSLLTDKDLLPYNLTVEYMRSRKPFKEQLLIDIIETINKEYGTDIPKDTCNFDIQVHEDCVLVLIKFDLFR